MKNKSAPLGRSGRRTVPWIALYLLCQGCGAESDPALLVESDTPGVPLQASLSSASKVELTWSDPGGGGSRHVIERIEGEGEFIPIATTDVGESTYTDLSVEQGTTYGYRVRRIGASPATSLVASVTTTWSRTYGGTGLDTAQHVQETRDHGFIIAGHTNSFGAGSMDAWVFKLDSRGAVEWEHSYGTVDGDRVNSIMEARDGGFILAGHVGRSETHWGRAWVIKLNFRGGVEWQKSFGGGEYDEAYSVAETYDGGYAVSVATTSAGAGDADVSLLKLSSSGDLIWQRTYGGPGYEGASSNTLQVHELSDHGFVLAGATSSYGAGFFDAWVLRLDFEGGIIWEKAYGGAGNDSAWSIQPLSNGGFLMAGTTKWSFGNDSRNFWVMNLDEAGEIVWEKRYGNGGRSLAYWLDLTKDGGCVVAGVTTSSGAGMEDYWILKLDGHGEVVWQSTYGGALSESIYAMRVEETSDGGYIVAGLTSSVGAGLSDAWVVKLGADGDIGFAPGSGLSRSSTYTQPVVTLSVVTPTNATVSIYVAEVHALAVSANESSAVILQQAP